MAETDTDTKNSENPSGRSTPETPIETVETAFIVDDVTEDVLRLRLDRFEGPFEVLLYLIRVQEIDIFDIPIAKITDQYLRFLDVIREENLDVAGEFLVMAATLIQIKARMLVPDTSIEDEEPAEEEDPRLELVTKLIEYRRFREISERLETLEEARADWFPRALRPQVEQEDGDPELTDVSLYDLVQAFRTYLRFFSEDLFHEVSAPLASVDDKIARIEELLDKQESVSWQELLRECANKAEVVCCLLAILELCRMGRIRAYQHRAFDDIRIFAASEGPMG